MRLCSDADLGLRPSCVSVADDSTSESLSFLIYRQELVTESTSELSRGRREAVAMSTQGRQVALLPALLTGAS